MGGGSELLLNLIFMCVFGGITAAIASSKGRNVGGWFVCGFFLGCIGIIIALCMSNLNEERARFSMQDDTNRRLREQLRQEQMKNEAFRQHTSARLDTHDDALGLETKSMGVGAIGMAGGGGPAEPSMLNVEGPQWFYSDAGRQVGPFSFEQIVEMIARGKISRDTQMWNNTRGEWIVANQMPELQDHLGA